MDTLHPARNDVTLGDLAGRGDWEQHHDELYVISARVYNDDADQALSPSDPNNACTGDSWHSHNDHVVDDHYHVADDTSELVTKDVASSHRQRRVRNSRTRGRDPGTDSAPTEANYDDRRNTHYCHDGERSKIDQTARNQLIIVSILCGLLMVAQIIGGILSNSLALVTDATHMASDLASFLVSLLAIWLATKPPSQNMTLGYHRAEVLGALTSVLIIWVVTGILVYMAAMRLQEDNYHILADEMLIIASIGVVFNIIMGLVLHTGIFKKCRLPSSIGHNHSHGNHGNNNNHQHHDVHESVERNHNEQSTDNSQSLSINAASQDHVMVTGLNPQLLQSHSSNSDRYGAVMETEREATIAKISAPKRNINIQAATIHVLGDFIQSVGVLVAAIIIKVKPEYQIADPICTFLFSVLVLITTISVLRDVILVLVEAKPRGINYKAICADLSQLEGVRSVHSLSLWSLTVNKTAAAVHIAIDADIDPEHTLDGATRILRHKHGVYLSTVQIENYTTLMEDCKLCQS